MALCQCYDTSDRDILVDTEMEDLARGATVAWVDREPLAAGRHRPATTAVCLDRNPVVTPELSAPVDIHNWTVVVGPSGVLVVEVQYLDGVDMAVDVVAVRAEWVEGKEDHSANMAEVLRRPSRTRRQGREEG